MKPAFATITLFFFFFFLAFSTKSSPVRADVPEPVVDISGEEVKAGESYYVLSACGEGSRCGLSFDTFDNRTCPHVVQEKVQGSKGKPVEFLLLNPENDVIYTSTNLNIKYSDMAFATCSESGVWRIIKLISEALNVATNGFSGTQDYVNWFMIEKAESEGAYKLKFCPNPPSIVCQDLDIFSVGDDGKRYVGLANPGQFQTLRVVFQKANIIKMPSMKMLML